MWEDQEQIQEYCGQLSSQFCASTLQEVKNASIPLLQSQQSFIQMSKRNGSDLGSPCRLSRRIGRSNVCLGKPPQYTLLLAKLQRRERKQKKVKRTLRKRLFVEKIRYRMANLKKRRLESQERFVKALQSRCNRTLAMIADERKKERAENAQLQKQLQLSYPKEEYKNAIKVGAKANQELDSCKKKLLQSYKDELALQEKVLKLKRELQENGE
jgi:hypothetical protein